MAALQTVRIDHPHNLGYLTINKRAFDPDIHTLYAVQAVAPVAPAEPIIPNIIRQQSEPTTRTDDTPLQPGDTWQRLTADGDLDATADYSNGAWRFPNPLNVFTEVAE